MNAVVLTEELSSRLRGELLQQLSRQLGISESQASNAVHVALPLLFGALGQNIVEPTGVEVLFGALQRYNFDIKNLLAATMQGGSQNNDVLERFFGNHWQRIVERLGETIDLDDARANGLLTMMAPIALSFLAERGAYDGLDAEELGHLLRPQDARSGLSGDLVSIPLDSDADCGGKKELGMFSISLAGL